MEKEETVAVKYGVGGRRDSKRSGCDKYGVGGRGQAKTKLGGELGREGDRDEGCKITRQQ